MANGSPTTLLCLLILIGLAGGMVLLVGRRVRVGWITVVGALLCAGGYLPVLLAAADLTPRHSLWSEPMPASLSRSMLPPAADLVSGKATPKDLRSGLAQSAGAMRAWFDMELMVPAIRDGTLPTACVEAIAEHCVDQWDTLKTRPGGREVIRALLQRLDPASPEYADLIDVLTASAGMKHPEATSHLACLEYELVAGRIDSAQAGAFAATLAHRPFVWLGRAPLAQRELVELHVRQPDGSPPSTGLPWRVHVTLHPETKGLVAESCEFPLNFPARKTSRIGLGTAPSAPGVMSATAAVTVTLDPVDIRESVLQMPSRWPPAGAKTFAGLSVTVPILITAEVGTREAPPVQLAAPNALAPSLDDLYAIRQNALWVSVVRGGAQCEVRLIFNKLPWSFVGDATLEYEGLTALLGRVVVPAGENVTVACSAKLDAAPKGNIILVLKPHPEWVTHSERLHAIYAGPPLRRPLRILRGEPGP